MPEGRTLKMMGNRQLYMKMPKNTIKLQYMQSNTIKYIKLEQIQQHTVGTIQENTRIYMKNV